MRIYRLVFDERQRGVASAYAEKAHLHEAQEQFKVYHGLTVFLTVKE